MKSPCLSIVPWINPELSLTRNSGVVLESADFELEPGLNSPATPFLLASGTYGGGGYCALKVSPASVPMSQAPDDASATATVPEIP